jgi:hypothetical protein
MKCFFFVFLRVLIFSYSRNDLIHKKIKRMTYFLRTKKCFRLRHSAYEEMGQS